MAYRYEKNQNGKSDLVIDGFEEGIADSPYKGIANMRNVNIQYYAGVVYANYKRLASTLSLGTFTFNASLSTGATSASLTASWVYATGTYSIVFSNGDVRNATFTNGSLTVSWVAAGGLSSSATATITVNLVSGGARVMGKPTFSTKSPSGLIYIQDDAGQIWKQNAFNSSTFTILTGQPSTGAQGQGIQWWNNYLVAFRGAYIDFCGDGTGDSGITSSNWNPSATLTPIGNITNLVITASISVGDTSATISTYTDAGGNNRSSTWYGISGTYLLTFADHITTMLVTLTNGSGTITFAEKAITTSTTSNLYIYALIPSNKHMSLASRNDGNLYFCNGNNVGYISQVSGYTFSPTNASTFNFSYSALTLSPNYDTAIWLEELVDKLLIAGNFNIYPWDRISTGYQNPVPIIEPISKMINVLNVIFIFAGQKGNIYQFNGYSLAPIKKMPDYIAGVIDPTWVWGGVMQHRQKLMFQATAFPNSGGNPIIAGIFSLDIGTGQFNLELSNAGALTMEAQNSFGLIETTTTGGGLLIDNQLIPPTGGAPYQDSYYSAWSSGTGDVGGIDYNDTTLWSSDEMVIETDLIPVGTYAQPMTYGSAEFKLDEPMKSGDSITLYARKSLSDSYTQLGTTTTTVLSDFYSPLNLQQFQWIQFKITMSCNATAASSSYNRLREIRIT